MGILQNSFGDLFRNRYSMERVHITPSVSTIFFIPQMKSDVLILHTKVYTSKAQLPTWNMIGIMNCAGTQSPFPMYTLDPMGLCLGRALRYSHSK